MSNLPIHTGTDEVSAHPHPIGHRWFDVTMAVCAIFISVISLVVAIEHGHTERDLVAASTWPYLRPDVDNVFGETRAVEIGVSNGGVGPAKIRSYEMFLDGQPIGSPFELLAACCGLPSDADGIRRLLPNGAVTSLIEGTVLRPGETNSVLIIPREKTDATLLSKLNDVLSKISFRACYCSVLDQCWIADLKSLEPNPVKSCPVPPHPYVHDKWLNPPPN